MKRSGGRSGRPLAHLQIDALEAHVRSNEHSLDELHVVRAELASRNSQRASELKDLVLRLIREKQKSFRY